MCRRSTVDDCGVMARIRVAGYVLVTRLRESVQQLRASHGKLESSFSFNPLIALILKPHSLNPQPTLKTLNLKP